jgi:hypothetical protein
MESALCVSAENIYTLLIFARIMRGNIFAQIVFNSVVILRSYGLRE